MIKKYLKKLLYWIGALLSDSKFASTRRFIGIQAFYNLVIFAILGFFYKQKLANTELIMQLASYFFVIAVSTIVGTTVTDLASIIKESKFTNNLEEQTDPFTITKDS